MGWLVIVIEEPQVENVILVDEQDNPTGIEEKLRAHQGGGRLHRAFSVFIFNDAGQLLLQRRAASKYHFGGLWTNTVCSHPQEGEALEDAVHRKLAQEFGFDTTVAESFTFTYRATDAASGLTEHEFDHVFVGDYAGEPRPNPAEVDDWKWADLRELERDLRAHPDRYTPWFPIAFTKLMERRRRGT